MTLHDTVTLDGDRLAVADPYDYTGRLSGTGLTLVPHAMGWPQVRTMTGRRKPGFTGTPYKPMIAYPVRGIATLWETAPPPPPDALAALIGRTRASILTTPAQPASTTIWPAGCNSRPEPSVSICPSCTPADSCPGPEPTERCSTAEPHEATP